VGPGPDLPRRGLNRARLAAGGARRPRVGSSVAVRAGKGVLAGRGRRDPHVTTGGRDAVRFRDARGLRRSTMQGG
jgi:hypothetical protein